MVRSSLHVDASTRRRLAQYKTGKLSYDALLNAFMDGVEPGEFKKRWRAAQREASRRLSRGERSSPGAAEGMEKAFHLYRLGRVRP